MDRNEESRRRMARDFERLSTGGEQGAEQALAEALASWGHDAVAQDAHILSTWEPAKSKKAPLWFPALVRSRKLSSKLVELGIELGGPAGDPEMQAWRYAAFNGWAREAADLFEAQWVSGQLPPRWPSLWAAVSQGCQAQEEGWGSKAASWIDSIAGGRIGPNEAKLLGLLGKAFDKGAPKELSQPAEPRAAGWDALCRAARERWGPCPAKDAAAAMSGHSAAKSLALAYCVPDKDWAQAQLAAMIHGFKQEMLEGGAEFEVVVAAQKPPGSPGSGLGWAESRSQAQAWAGSAAQLAAMGASWPSDALADACAGRDWMKAYALALGGAPLDPKTPPPLWALSNSRRNDPLREAVGQIAMSNYGTISIDEQAVDVARALAGAGARASDKGPDGKDALQALYEPGGASMASLGAELLGALMGKPSAPAAKRTPREEVESRGLGAYADYLSSLADREQIEAMTGAGSARGEGPARL